MIYDSNGDPIARPLGPTHRCSYCGERIDPDEAVPDFDSHGYICPDCYVERRAMRDR